MHDPSDIAVVWSPRFLRVGLSIVLLQRARDEEPSHHEEGAENEGRAATDLVEVKYGREGECDIDYILNRGCQKRGGDLGPFHDVDNVVYGQSENCGG
jgi:hypothetical protein